jgi:hypothetical protein
MIDVLTPLNLIILILTTFVTTVLVGHASKKAILKPIENIFGIRANIAPEGALEKLLVYSALGFVFIIIYSIILSVFTLLNRIGVLVIVGFSLITELVSLLKRKKGDGERLSDYLGIVKTRIKKFLGEPCQIFLLGLLIVAIVWYFYPAIGLSSYPGGDDRSYIFITKQIIDRGTALIAIHYPYAQAFQDHLVMAGFMTVAAFFYNLLPTVGLPTTIPTIHLFLVLLFFSLTPISMYLFTRGLSENKEFSMTVALASLFLWKSILLYFYWGGLGEAMGYVLVPFLALVDYRLNENLMKDKSKLRLKTFTGTLIIKSIMLVVAMYVHIYSLALFVFLVLVVTPLYAMRNYLQGKGSNIKRKAKIYLILILPYLVLSFGVVVLLIGVKPLLQLTGNMNAAIERLYDFMFSSPQDILNASIQLNWTAPYLVLKSGYGLDYAFSEFTYILGAYNGEWIGIFIVLYVFCIIYLRLFRNREKSFYGEGTNSVRLTNLMALTAIFFFLFIQNSPFGWYYVPYPLAESMLAVRLYYEFNVFLIFIEALPIYLVYMYAKKKIAGPNDTSKGRSNGRLPRRSTKHINLKRTGAVVIAFIFVASVFLPYSSYYYNVYAYQRIHSIVTSDDLNAFRWIDANTPKDAIFFVSSSDAGAYIYIYTSRIVLPPDTIGAWDLEGPVSEGFSEASEMLIIGNITQQLVQQLTGYNVSYVYVGEKSQFGGPLFNLTALLQSPYFEVAFNQSGTYVFEINMKG